MIKLSQSDKDKLQTKVSREYGRADMYTKSWKEEVKNLWHNYLLPKPWQDKIKIRKVLNNLNIRLATFLSDELEVTNVPMNGVLGRETAENCDKVFQAMFDSAKIKNKYREALIDDALQWVGVLAVDGWNDYKQEPIVSYIDSRLCFPDPKNWQDNTMTFFGTKLRKSVYELESDEAYDQEALKTCRFMQDSDIKDIDRANNGIKGFNEDIQGSEDLVEIYNHLTIFKSEEDEKHCIYLTTWGVNRSILLRCLKLRPLNDGEIADPSTVDFGVKLFRAKPIKGSFAGASLVDDVGQFQDIETLLTNLQIRQSQEAGLGGKTYVNTELGVDLDDVANNTGPWDVIPFTPINPNINAQTGIYREQSMPVNPIIQNTIQYLDNLSQEADPSGSALAQGQTMSGSQTKAEIQTLQQNINHILSYMAGNYMDSLRGLWESVYRSFATNMSNQRIKEIVVVNTNGQADSFGFKKREFIANGEIYIKIKSKAQENIKKKQDFSVLLAVIGTLKQSVQPWSYQDTLINRLLVDKSGINGIDSLTLYPLTPDERKAFANLEILNRNQNLKTKPQVGEPHEVYINIYKLGIRTEAQERAIRDREIALESEPKQETQMPQQSSGVAQQLGASMLSSDMANKVPSTQDVSV